MAPPSPPTITQVDRGFVAPNVSSFLIAYTSVGGGAEYEIHVFDGTSNSIFGPSTSLTQSIGLSPAGGTYTITIRARILAQDPGWSAFANAPNNPYTGLTSAPVAPDVPTGLTVTPNFDTEAYFVLDWADNAQPTSGALAMPRGGVTATGIPTAARFGQASDLYDVLGMNVHVHSTANATYLNGTALTALLADMGVRHFRMGISDALYTWKGPQNQHMTNAVRTHNAATPGNGKQPVFWDAIMTSPGSNPPAANVHDFPDSYDNDPGGPYKSPSYGGYADDDGIAWTGYSPARIVQGIERTSSNVPWDIIGLVMGFNEPHNLTHPTWNGHAMKNNWDRPMRDLLRARTSTPAFSNKSFVTTAGIQASGGMVSQIPKVGPSIIGRQMADMLGDMTTGYNDLGDRHPYGGMAKEPSTEVFNQDDTDTWNYRAQYYGGTALPQAISEFGNISNGMDVVDTGGHGGYWPSPNDVIAEYDVRYVLKFWLRGGRRIHFYEFLDQGTAIAAEHQFGFVTFGGVKKPQYFAMKNLLSLIGFSEAPAASRGALPYSLAGFSAGAANTHIAMFQGTSPGQPAPGQPYWTSADALESCQVQQSANQWVIFLWRNKWLWERERGNWSTNVPGTGSRSNLGNVANGRKAPPTPQDITVTLPGNVVSAEWAQPAWNTQADPYMQVTTANEAEGRTWRGPLQLNTVGSNKTVVVPITDHTKAIRVTTA